MPDESGKGSSKDLEIMGQRTYRVTARMLEQFPEIVYFVSPKSQILWHLQKVLFPLHAGVNPDNMKELPPKGFRLLNAAIDTKFNRDLARHAAYFNPATHEEILASKFVESKTDLKRLEGKINPEGITGDFDGYEDS